MKKFAALILTVASLFLLISCGEDYPPVESTEKEAAVVMEMELEGEKYEVRYELYRALFLSLKGEVDGGDDSVWSGSDKSTYTQKIDAMIRERAADIYATFHIAKKIGIDVYSSDFEDDIDEYIKASIEGGDVGGYYFDGFGGDYDAYLKSLKDMNLNYSVQTLMIRYALASNAVEKHYAGSLDENHDQSIGSIEYTRENIKSFYDSDECVRVLRVILDSSIWTLERTEAKRDAIEALGNENDVALYMINISTIGGEDIINGDIISRYNLDMLHYSELVTEAFGLSLNETSKVIKISSDTEDGFVIMFRVDKSNEHFEKCYDDIAAAYVQNEIGRILYGASSVLSESCESTSVLDGIDRASISMD